MAFKRKSRARRGSTRRPARSTRSRARKSTRRSSVQTIRIVLEQPQTGGLPAGMKQMPAVRRHARI